MAGAVIALAAVPAWRTKLLSAKFRAPAIAMEQGSGQWTPFGAAPLSYVSNPGTNSPHSGRVSSIAVDPRDSRRWLLGVGNGGVWETRDSGETWTPITDDALSSWGDTRGDDGRSTFASNSRTAQTFVSGRKPRR